jgi:hypothetical protein
MQYGKYKGFSYYLTVCADICFYILSKSNSHGENLITKNLVYGIVRGLSVGNVPLNTIVLYYPSLGEGDIG